MATKTISNTGGNWNSGSAWVGGVAPASGTDVIVATDTSGPLTVNITTAICTTLDLTGYISTMTISEGMILIVKSAVTLAGNNIEGTGFINFEQAGDYNVTLTSNGFSIPNLYTNIVRSIVLVDHATIRGDFVMETSCGLSGVDKSLFVGGSFSRRSTGAIYGALSGTATLVMNGTGTFGHADIAYARSYFGVSCNVTINGTAVTLLNFDYLTGTFTHTAGGLMGVDSQMIIIGSCSINSLPPTTNLTWAWANSTLTMGASLVFNSLAFTYNTDATAWKLTFSGAYDITIAELYFGTITNGQSSGQLTFPTGYSINVTSLLGSSLTGTGATIASSSNSTPFYLNYTGLIDPFLVNINFTRCDATGSRNLPIYVWKGTLTSCDNMIVPNPASAFSGCSITLAHF